ncbi:MAG: hypothetical protein HY898_09690 [Deltaproteobacteria bacterium]|nr:hypothetical protein [Deltaproteobacteria bacterium]
MYPARALAFLTAALVTGCGAAPPPPAPTPVPATSAAPDPIPAPKAEAPKPEDKPVAELPTHCSESKNAKVCLPDQAFVERLCSGSWPDIALVLFRKESPWTRAYVVRPVNAWNAMGGAMSTSAKLPADEELIVLKHRSNPGGMVVSGASGGYDALRWDGTCVSLSGDEVTLRRPGLPRHAAIPWRKLAEKTQTSLLSDKGIKQSFDRRRKDCQGDATGPGPSPCERAESALSSGIVSYVRSGGAVPQPADLP